MPTNRLNDVVLFGATGFTGTLTAEYLVRHAPAGSTMALAGRNGTKLEQLRARLARLAPENVDIAVLRADVTDSESLRVLAASTKVVITTVGPYTHYGEPLVAACAEAGTDYVDLCGEPEFVDLMYLRHAATARRSGARLVHACGFDSIPYDLGAYFTVRKLPSDAPIALHGQVHARATFSAGTFHSAVTAFSRPFGMMHALRQRRKAQPRAEGRKARIRTGTPHRDSDTGMWLVPAPTIDPRIVLQSALASPSYGPDFTYRHYFAIKRLSTIAAGAAGLTALFATAQIPPARRRVLHTRSPGTGPSEQKRAKSWFTVRFTGESGGHRVTTEVAGGDPGYDETAKMLAESALCLAFDELPNTSGQVTTAVAMGDALINRLIDAGIEFRVVG